MNASSSQWCRSVWPLLIPELYTNILMIITVILSPIMLLLNLFLIFAINKVQHRKSTTDKLMVCMSASDAVSGGITFPLIAVMLKSTTMQQNCIYQLALQYLAFSFGYTSFFLLIAIALDRYLHLIKLNRYNEFMNEFRFRLIMTVIFVASNSLALVTIFVQSFNLQVAMNAMNIVGITSIFTMYCSVLRSILSHAKTLNRIKASNVSSNAPLERSSRFNDSKLDNSEERRQMKFNDKGQSENADKGDRNDMLHEISITKIDCTGAVIGEKGTKQGNNSSALKKAKSKRKLLASNKRDQSVTRTIMVLLLTVFVLYNPYNVLSTMWFYYRFKKNVDPGKLLNILTFASYIILFCNGIANVLILANSNANIRRYIRKTFCGKKVTEIRSVSEMKTKEVESSN